ncbi:uncharacterized protein MELLADRAFT_118143 [Melampsora larici-populina 98AG31]|uniref:Exocyst complex component SEC15 n=1 Tax=Melampsora larici-populina (strain 98AG31 / pathotype 3-4-7) TaxID=747676 RepID=F4S5J6_MELLP|nr:uncharacterized protein MELLADRAFT_118143 [Melampsora larici-populina 98AG31]EGG00037.1 hypothetical protein MELLADRAFT_118143 [Melampsora larici-populina 98AG31]
MNHNQNEISNRSITKKTFFTHADIEAQLQNLYLYSDFSSTTRSGHQDQLDHLGPIIRNIHLSKQQDAFLRHLLKFMRTKEAEIEAVCHANHQDFIGSVDKLLSVRQGTLSLRSHVVSLDSSLQSSGASLASARSSLLDARKVASNIDDTIDTLQACLRVLDLSKKVSQQIQTGKFYSALRSLDELQFIHLKPLLPFAAFAGYLGEALPNEKIRVREEVTKQLNSWLYEARERSGSVGKLAMEGMEMRTRRWKARRDRVKHQDSASLAMLVDVNTPVEMAVSERHEYNVLESTQSRIDFSPLYLAIHIYETLDANEELRKSFRDDRRAQAHLIVSSTASSPFSLENLASLMESIVGFFIIEAHVLHTTKSFRDETDVDNLWEEMCERVVAIITEGIGGCEDLDIFLGIKTKLLTFAQTAAAYEYPATQLNVLLSSLFERYTDLLRWKYGTDFQQIVLDDDHQPMTVNNEDEFSKVVEVSFLPEQGEWAQENLITGGYPAALPFSQTYPLCCIDIRNFVTKYYHFADGFVSAMRDTDDVLRKSLDKLLIKHINGHIRSRVQNTRNLSQLSQIVINLQFFQTACLALERLLVTLRVTPRGGLVKLDSSRAFQATLSFSEETILSRVHAKIKDFFELAEYDWTTDRMMAVDEDGEASVYLIECMNYLKTVMTSVLSILPHNVRVAIHLGAWSYIAQRLMGFFVEREPIKMSDGGLSYLANDIRFAVSRAKSVNIEGVEPIFEELVQIVGLLESPDVGGYLDPDYREMKYKLVTPRRLAPILIKLVTHLNSINSAPDPSRKEAMEDVLKAVSRA